MTRFTETSAQPSAQPSALSRAACRRRRVLGIDLWVERVRDEEQVVADARSAAMTTHLRLAAASVEELEEGAVRAGEWGDLRLRFLARRDDVHVTDEAICELLGRIPPRLRWVSLVKLEEFDGCPSFAALPAF